MKVLVCGSGVMAKFTKESIENSGNECVGMYDPLGNGDYKTLKELNQEVDVIIDFSHFSMIESILEYAVENSKPLLIATTGHSDIQMKLIEETAKKIAILQTTNTSLGVNILNEIVGFATQLLNKFDIEVVEKHHNRKIDSPSGTAKTILNVIKNNIENEAELIYGREGNKKRTEHEIGVHSIRAGNIVGEHTVIYSKGDEIIEISHEALSRKVFSDGAVVAAKFLINKTNGMFTMKDVLKI